MLREADTIALLETASGPNCDPSLIADQWADLRLDLVDDQDRLAGPNLLSPAAGGLQRTTFYLLEVPDHADR